MASDGGSYPLQDRGAGGKWVKPVGAPELWGRELVPLPEVKKRPGMDRDDE